MSIDAITVTAIATSVYGLATLLLVFQIWRDRVQRESHFREETANRKLNELRSAFYDAWGYWHGHKSRSGDSIVDALQAGRVFEGFIRLECQLRLNGFKTEANNLGYTIRTNIQAVDMPLGEAGVALGLTPSEYRRFVALVNPPSAGNKL
jgi:hypothetical protein